MSCTTDCRIMVPAKKRRLAGLGLAVIAALTTAGTAYGQVSIHSSRVGGLRTYSFEAQRYGVERAGFALSRRYGDLGWTGHRQIIDYRPAAVYHPRVIDGTIRYRPSYTFTGSAHVPGYTVYEPVLDVTTSPGWWTPTTTYRPRVSGTGAVILGSRSGLRVGTVISQPPAYIAYQPYYTYHAPIRPVATLDLCPSQMIPGTITVPLAPQTQVSPPPQPGIDPRPRSTR